MIKTIGASLVVVLYVVAVLSLFLPLTLIFIMSMIVVPCGLKDAMCRFADLVTLKIILFQDAQKEI
jgi:hypothetical protein